MVVTMRSKLRKQSHLHGDEDDREDDADLTVANESKPVVKQVPACQLENQRHNALDPPGRFEVETIR